MKVFGNARRNWEMSSSVFAIHAISFFAPERRSQTARGLREDSDGRKVRQKARNLLRQAGARATRAAKGKKAKLSAACAAALKEAAGQVAAGL